MEKRQLFRLYMFISLFGIFIVIMSMLFAMFYNPPAIFTTTLWAEKVMIKGQPGQPSAWIGQGSDGNLGIFFYDQAKINRMSIILYPNGQPGIEFIDNNRKPSFGLTLSDAGFPAILIFNKEGVRKSRILRFSEDQKDISILDEHGNLIGSIQ